MFLGSLIKRGLDRVLKPNETLKESFANAKFLLFRVLLQGCNIFLRSYWGLVESCLGAILATVLGGFWDVLGGFEEVLGDVFLAGF